MGYSEGVMTFFTLIYHNVRGKKLYLAIFQHHDSGTEGWIEDHVQSLVGH